MLKRPSAISISDVVDASSLSEGSGDDSDAGDKNDDDEKIIAEDEEEKEDAEKKPAQEKMQKKPAAQAGTNADVDLNAQIVEFQKEVASLPKSEQGKPNIDILRRHFSDAQRSTLWMRLKTERASAPQNVKEAWNCLTELGHITARKQKVLFDFLTGKDWGSNLLTSTQMLRKDELYSQSSTPLTRGEPEQQVGFEESERKISEGKYEETVDSDGEVLYVKKQKKFTSSTLRREEVALSRTALD